MTPQYYSLSRIPSIMDKHGAPPPYSPHDPLTPSTTPVPGSATPRLANPPLPFNSSPPIHDEQPYTRQECRRRSRRHCCAHGHEHNPDLPVSSQRGHSHPQNYDEGRGRCGRRGRQRFGRHRSPSTSSSSSSFSSSSSSSSSAASANNSINAENHHAAEMNGINTAFYNTHIKEPRDRPLHNIASLILERIQSHRNSDHRALHKESRAIGKGLRAEKRQAKKMLRAQKRVLKEEFRAFHREAKERHRAGDAKGEWERGECGRRRRDRHRNGKLD